MERYKVQYKEIIQRKLQEERVLKSLQQANESGKKCQYSEEQILEAQCQLGKKQMNDIYHELINPISNTLIYFIYSLATLILLPILYINNEEGANIAVVIAYILMMVMLIIMQVIKNSIKKDTEKKREWIKYFNRFSNDTYGFGYILTSLGYIMVKLESGMFWYIYAVMIVVFLITIIVDLVNPLAINLRKYFGNRKSGHWNNCS